MKFRQVVIQLLIGLVLVSCGESEAPPVVAERKIWSLPIDVVKLEKLPVTYMSTGTVVSDQRIEVSSRSTGYIREILVHEGEEVKRGQILIKLDGADVEGAISQAEAVHKTATLSLKDANIDFQRFKDLYVKGNVSESQMRKIRLFRDSSQEALLKSKTALKTALSRREYIDISSQIRGVVVARHHREGDLATPGKSILTVEASQGLLFDTFVAESQISKIKRGDSVQVRIDALGLSLVAVVARVVPVGDPITRRYKVKVALPEQEGLLSGMFGRVHFVLESKESPVVPATAIIERGGLQGVFVINQTNRAHFRWLQLGVTTAGTVEVRSGLEGGERIIIAVNPAIGEGDIIKSSTPSVKDE
ncbi:MAG: efflux RND transporter periplasmic adaptor subunit [Pseudomonadales bacterium]|nr:efflux RND transporter periplasmic adaptor subunit [Pseudomonadales bacterium]